MALVSTDPTAAFNAANHAVKLDRFMVAAGGEPNTPSKPVKVKVSLLLAPSSFLPLSKQALLGPCSSRISRFAKRSSGMLRNVTDGCRRLLLRAVVLAPGGRDVLDGPNSC